MKKGWKITLITLGSLLGLVVAVVLVALWLVFTPSQLTKIVNRLAANYIGCETTFGEVDLTLFRTFPDAGLRIDDVCVVNPTAGAPTDTVAHIGSLTVGVDVRKYLKENEVVVHQVLLDDVVASLFVARDGSSNYDIFPSGSDDDDSVKTPFSLDSLPCIDLRKVAVSGLNASMLDARSGIKASVTGMDFAVVGKLTDGKVDADLELEVGGGQLSTTDSTGTAAIDAALEGLLLSLKGEGNTDEVRGLLKVQLQSGSLAMQGQEMVNERLRASQHKLLTLKMPFEADLRQMKVALRDEASLSIDDYGLTLYGQVALASEQQPLTVDAALRTDGTWQVAPLLQMLPERYVTFAEGMDVDAKVSLDAKACGTLTDSTMPVVDAHVAMDKGSFYMPRALPYKVSRIGGEATAHLDLGRGGRSYAVVENLRAHTHDTDLRLKGRADDLTGDMRLDVSLQGSLPLEDLMPLLPDTLHVAALGSADLDIKADLRLSQLKDKAFDRMKASADVKLRNLDVTYDSLHATSPTLNLALQLPASRHTGRLADAHITGTSLTVSMPGIEGTLQNPDISVGVNNPLAEQLAAAFEVEVGETEANMDSMMVSLQALKVSGTMRLDSTQANPLRKFNPEASVDLHSAVLYMPELPDAVRLSQFSLRYGRQGCHLNTAEVKLGHSDFQLYGSIDNLEQWLDHEAMLQADLNFTSTYADVDQIMDLFSGMGSDADSLQQMREEDNVPADANPFIVPKDVDITLHTHIKRSVAFGNDLNDVAGALTVKDGVAVLDQMGFVCKAATMQLTALYKSPRPNNLFVALDFHLLDIQIDELLDMIPAVDTLVPMLAAFNGNANFHLAAETFLDARYQPKMSSLLGSAAISGRNLVVMDNSTIAQIAKLMQLKSWKDNDNKIRIDSLDVEMTCLRKEIEVYPFLLNVGKYQLCASGKHTLDNQCGYHIELLKNPLLARVGVDVRGSLSSPKVSLGQVRYADLYKPERQGVVEKRTLELKHMIRQALEANVR